MRCPQQNLQYCGLYTSVVIIPDNTLRQKFNQAIQTLHLTKSNVFGIAALEAAYKYGEPWLEELLPFLSANAAYLAESLRKKTPKIKFSPPEGTFLAWLDCRALGLTGTALHDFFAREAKLGLNKGTTFGMQGSGFMRLNFGCTRTVLSEAVDRLARAYAARGY